MGQPEGTVRYTFRPDGTINWFSDIPGSNVTQIAPTIELSGLERVSGLSPERNSTAINYKVDVPLLFSSEVLYVNKGRSGCQNFLSNEFKVIINVSSTLPGRIFLPFLSASLDPIVCDNRNHLITVNGAGLNFSDSVESFGAVCTQAGVFFTIPAGISTIDPSTVSTTATASATAYPKEHKLAFANGRYWSFYEGTGIQWRHSTDAVTWSSASTFRASVASTNIGIWIDAANNKIYYAVNSGTNELLRSGTLNSDGTITFDFAEVVFSFSATCSGSGRSGTAVSTTGVWYFTILCDQAAGNSLIGVFSCSATCSSSANWAVSTTKSAGTTDTNWTPTIHQYSGGDMVLAWTRTTNTKMSICDFISGSWCGTPTTTTSNFEGGAFSGVTVANEFFVCGQSASTTIRYFKWTKGDSTAPTETVMNTATANQCTIETDSSSALGIFYASSGASATTVYQRVSTNLGGTFAAETALTSSETNINTQILESARICGNGKYLVQWTALAANPFDIRFDASLTCGGAAAFSRTVTDVFTFTDSIAGIGGLARIISDTFAFADAISGLVGAKRTLSDTFTFSDVIITNNRFTFTLADTFSFTEDVVAICFGSGCIVLPTTVYITIVDPFPRAIGALALFLMIGIAFLLVRRRREK